MYARKLAAEMTIGAERRPVPLDWLDSFCMRNFTGSAEFDDTLPKADGMLEAGLSVDPARLATAMSEWFTKREKGTARRSSWSFASGASTRAEHPRRVIGALQSSRRERFGSLDDWTRAATVC